MNLLNRILGRTEKIEFSTRGKKIPMLLDALGIKYQMTDDAHGVAYVTPKQKDQFLRVRDVILQVYYDNYVLGDFE